MISKVQLYVTAGRPRPERKSYARDFIDRVDGSPWSRVFKMSGTAGPVKYLAKQLGGPYADMPAPVGLAAKSMLKNRGQMAGFDGGELRCNSRGATLEDLVQSQDSLYKIKLCAVLETQHK